MFDLSNLASLAKNGAEMAKNAGEVASFIKKGAAGLGLGSNKKKGASNGGGDIRYSASLEKLIAMVIEDGTVTDEEMALLRRKAEKEGADPDEVEFVVRHRLRTASGGQPPKSDRKESKCRKDDDDDDDFGDDDSDPDDDIDLDDAADSVGEIVKEATKGKLLGGLSNLLDL